MTTVAVDDLHAIFHGYFDTGPRNDEHHWSDCTQTSILNDVRKTTRLLLIK